MIFKKYDSTQEKHPYFLNSRKLLILSSIFLYTQRYLKLGLKNNKTKEKKGFFALIKPVRDVVFLMCFTLMPISSRHKN